MLMLLSGCPSLLLCTLPLVHPVEEPVCLSYFVCLVSDLTSSPSFCLSGLSCLSVSCVISCGVSCNVFCNCCSSSLKSRSSLCSLALAFLPSQSSLDQSDGVTEGCGASNLQYIHPFEVLVQFLGSGLDYVNFVVVSHVTVLCVIPVHFYRIETMPLVRPSGSGLSWGTFTFGLGRCRK